MLRPKGEFTLDSNFCFGQLSIYFAYMLRFSLIRCHNQYYTFGHTEIQHFPNILSKLCTMQIQNVFRVVIMDVVVVRLKKPVLADNHEKLEYEFSWVKHVLVLKHKQ